MPEFKLNEKGFLVDEKDNQIKIGEDTVQLQGYLPQAKVDEIVQTRLKNKDAELDEKKKKLKLLEDEIKVFNSQPEKSPAVQQLLEQKQKDFQTMQLALQNAEKSAQEAVSVQLQNAKEQATNFEKLYMAEKNQRVKDQVENLILSKTGSMFMNAKKDVLPALLSNWKREPKLDVAGKPIENQFVDLFEIEYYDKDSKTKKSGKFEVEKAVQLFYENPENEYYRSGKIPHQGGGGGIGNLVTPLQQTGYISPVQKITAGLQNMKLGDTITG